jgi:hypothetical protein
VAAGPRSDLSDELVFGVEPAALDDRVAIVRSPRCVGEAAVDPWLGTLRHREGTLLVVGERTLDVPVEPEQVVEPSDLY